MILVAGPPCGGKTSYVREHLAAGEEVLGGDRYARETELVEAARVEWARRLPDADWVVWSAPRRGQRGRIRGQFGARVVVVTASLEECLRRARAERPPAWQDLVRAWFAAWEPSRSGELLVDTTPRPAESIFGAGRG